MRGVLGWGTHVPYRRLDRTAIRSVAGAGGGKGARAVAGYDEDATTMAVAAARHALSSTAARPATLWLASTTPTYLDKTNATAVHAALRLDAEVGAYDANGSVRSAVGLLVAALDAPAPSLVVASDLRVGLPGGSEEASAGDAAAAIVVGGAGDGEVRAELLASARLTEEFQDRWRVPGGPASTTWEERFGESRYVPLGTAALKTALAEAGLDAGQVDRLIVAGLHERAIAAVSRASGIPTERLADRLVDRIGNPGAAQPLLLLAAALESARSDDVIVLLTLSDGADAIALRATGVVDTGTPAASVQAQLATSGPVSYGRYLGWRGLLPVEPPRRPAPVAPSASAAARGTQWKFGLASPAGVLADQHGTVATFTVDRLAYSPSPPVVFAVVDFDDGERLPVELTDVDAEEVSIGMRVEMTFRRLYTGDGVANYFWKARPLRTGGH